MKRLVVVQARVGSTRLPGKVLLDVVGKPLLVRMIERLQSAKTPFDLVVATTTEPEEDPIARLCEQANIAVYRGHPTDLLHRHVSAARALGADIVAKIPSDCPLIDPAIVDRMFAAFDEYGGRGDRVDYLSNLHPATYPDGNDVEIMPLSSLETAEREATRPLEREHTTPFLWERPERFALKNVLWERGLDHSMSHRFTIDYPEDYEFICAVFRELHGGPAPFSLDEILSLLERKPEILRLNSRYAGVNWYRHHIGELRTVGAHQTRSTE